jgi:hypothetical protein
MGFAALNPSYGLTRFLVSASVNKSGFVFLGMHDFPYNEKLAGAIRSRPGP